MSPWPIATLGEILREEKQRIGTPDADVLPLLGVSNTDGLHRSGMNRISDMSRYLRVKRGWFAYNPMRINVGSIGWAKDEGQTGVISPDYVVFSCTDRVMPELIHWFLKHRRGLQAINAETAGSVRERLYFEALARIKFPLPPPEEQARLVGKIDALVAKVEEGKQLRGGADRAAERLMLSMAHRGDIPSDQKVSQGWKQVKLGEVVTLRTEPVPVNTTSSYPNLGIYSFGRGLFKKPAIDGLATSAATLYRVRTGQFIYSGPRKLDRRLSYTGGPREGNQWQASGRVTRRRSRPRSHWPPLRATRRSTRWPPSSVSTRP